MDIPNWVTGAGQLAAIVVVVYLNNRAVADLQNRYLADQKEVLARVEAMEDTAQKHVDANTVRFIEAQKEERIQNRVMFDAVVSLNREVTQTVEKLASSLHELSEQHKSLAQAITDQGHRQQQLANAISELQHKLGAPKTV